MSERQEVIDKTLRQCQTDGLLYNPFYYIDIKSLIFVES